MIEKFPKALRGRFGIIHHKALNTRKNLDAALAVAERHSNQLHVFEGDLCWGFDQSTGDFHYYFFHPHYGFDYLTDDQVSAQNKTGEVLTLPDVIASVPENVLLIIELKVGTGDVSTCFDQLITKLQTHFLGRYWIDTFSKTQLALIHAKDKSIPLSIHTERIIGANLWTIVPEWPPFYMTRLSDLGWLDGLSIRHWNNFSNITEAAQTVKRQDKALFISRISTQKRLEHAFTLRANAGYFETEDIEKFMPFIQAHTLIPD